PAGLDPSLAPRTLPARRGAVEGARPRRRAVERGRRSGERGRRAGSAGEGASSSPILRDPPGQRIERRAIGAQGAIIAARARAAARPGMLARHRDIIIAAGPDRVARALGRGELAQVVEAAVLGRQVRPPAGTGAGHHHGARRRDVERGLAQPVRGRPLATAAAPGEKGKEEEEEEEKEDEEERGQGGLRAPRAAAPFAREERARPPARGAIAHPSSFTL